jgi:hypothetical protein
MPPTEDSTEQPSALAKVENITPHNDNTEERNLRDNAIEMAEKSRWTDLNAQEEVISTEKIQIRATLAEHTKNIEQGINNHKESGGGPLEEIAVLPKFLLKSCGIEETAIEGLQRAVTQIATGAGAGWIEPQLRHMVLAIYTTINNCIERPFIQGSFHHSVLRNFERTRRATFPEDQTTRALYLDLVGEGFYRMPEGEALIEQQASSDSSTTALAASGF